MNTITAWSYSRLALYEQCPLAFRLKNIDKLKEASSPAMERGKEVHEASASYVTGVRPVMPPELARHYWVLAKELREIPSSQKIVEQQWGFTKSWRATGWFGKDVWFRAILDAGVVYPDGTADVIDFKTGKKYGTNEDQMQLFALATMYRYPHVTHVTTRLWYLDSGEEDILEFNKSEKVAMTKTWEARVAPMFADEVFIPRPNDKCRFCSFANSKGGVCKFG